MERENQFGDMKKEAESIISDIAVEEYYPTAEDRLFELLDDSEKEIFRCLDQETQKAILSLKKTGEPIDLKDPDADLESTQIAFVRASGLTPSQKISDRDPMIGTTYTSTKGSHGVQFRDTSHWTINHVVARHLMGNWDASPYILISPGDKFIKVNNLPLAMSTVDTYWDNDIELPPNTIIIVNESASSENMETDGLRIIKAKGETARGLVPIVLKQLGYTPIEGGTHASNSANIEDMIGNFCKRNDISEAKHFYSKEKGLENGIIESYLINWSSLDTRKKDLIKDLVVNLFDSSCREDGTFYQSTSRSRLFDILLSKSFIGSPKEEIMKNVPENLLEKFARLIVHDLEERNKLPLGIGSGREEFDDEKGFSHIDRQKAYDFCIDMLNR